jgi:DNA repair protein RadD
LIRQALAKLADAGVPHGVIAPGFDQTDDLVQVGSVQTVTRRLELLPPFDLIIIDEAHHAVAGQYRKIIDAQPRARLLGVTATPERFDGRGLGIHAGGCFDALVLGPMVDELIDDQYLTPARIFAPANGPDLSAVSVRRGDYDATELVAAMDAPALTGDAVAHYAQHAPGLPAIAFCISVKHAEHVAEVFRAAGWRAVAAHGGMPADERDAAIGGLATGAVQVLTSCDLVSEGLDVPAVGAVILLRPTKSLGLYLQQVGRGLRPAQGKQHLIVLDHAGCTEQHGFPDSPRDWSLDGRPKKAKAPPVKRCKSCFALHPPAPKCPACGFVCPKDEVAEERQIEQRDGVLAEVMTDRLRHLREAPLRSLVDKAKTRAELVEIQRARGFKPGWVWYAMQEKSGAGVGDRA